MVCYPISNVKILQIRMWDGTKSKGDKSVMACTHTYVVQ